MMSKYEIDIKVSKDDCIIVSQILEGNDLVSLKNEIKPTVIAICSNIENANETFEVVVNYTITENGDYFDTDEIAVSI